jgi:hypothetical protein
MQFPHQIIYKYTNSYLMKLKIGKLKIKDAIHIDSLRFFIATLEINYLPIIFSI